MFRYKRTTEFWVRPVRLGTSEFGYEFTWFLDHFSFGVGPYKCMLICLSNKKCLLLSKNWSLSRILPFLRSSKVYIVFMSVAKNIDAKTGHLSMGIFIYIQSNLAIIKYSIHYYDIFVCLYYDLYWT